MYNLTRGLGIASIYWNTVLAQNFTLLVCEDSENWVTYWEWIWSKSLKSICPWTLSVKQNDYILEVSLRMCSFLKISSTNCSLLSLKSIEKSPTENQWLVNIWTEGKPRISQLAESWMGGAFIQWTPWAFFSPILGHQHSAMLQSAHSSHKPSIHSCCL